MAKSAALGMRFWIGGLDISGDVSRINQLASPRGVLPATAINSAAVERLLAHSDGLIDFTTYFNDATDQEHDALKGLPTADVVALLALSTTRGDPAWGLVAKQVNYDLARGADGSLEFTVQLLGQGSPLEDLVMLTTGEETHASATSSSSLDENGATGSSALGATCYLAYRERDSGTPTFIVEDSTDNSGWATLLTFPTTGGVTNFAERATVTGNVDRHLRITTTGTFVNADFAVGFRRGRTGDIENLS